jgi:hypothetical protein
VSADGLVVLDIAGSADAAADRIPAPVSADAGEASADTTVAMMPSARAVVQRGRHGRLNCAEGEGWASGWDTGGSRYIKPSVAFARNGFNGRSPYASLAL